MAKRNDAEYRDRRGGTKFQVVGPPQPNPRHGIYLRVESIDGKFLGALDGVALRNLSRRLAKYVLGEG